MRGYTLLIAVAIVSGCAKPSPTTSSRPVSNSKVVTWSVVQESIRAGQVTEVILAGGESHFSSFTQVSGLVLILESIPDNLESFIRTNAPNAAQIQIRSALLYPGVKEKN